MVSEGKYLKNSGFTFVEILVVIVTMSVLFSFGYAGYRDYARRQNLEAWARKVSGDLRMAQQLASSGAKPSNDCGVLEGYHFRVNAHFAHQRYYFGPICSDFSDGQTNAHEKVVQMPEDIFINAIEISGVAAGSDLRIVFKVLEQGTNIPAGSSATITLAQVGNIRKVRRPNWRDYGVPFIDVIVTSGGEVRY